MSAYDFTRRPASRPSVSSRLLLRLTFTALFFLVLPVAADAYTLVMRSGRLVNVPADFKVTPTAVIYEASPGFTVTVWLSNVDFAATPAPEAVKEGRPPARRVVTDKDLEPWRLRREAQEEQYERTRRARGMPSKREWQRRVEEEDRGLREWARQMREESREAELESLRAGLAEARRALSELSLRLSQQPAGYVQAYAAPGYYPYPYAPPFQVVTVLPFGHRRPAVGGGFSHRWPQRPWPGRTFPTVVNRSWTARVLPRVPSPAMRAPRR